MKAKNREVDAKLNEQQQQKKIESSDEWKRNGLVKYGLKAHIEGDCLSAIFG